MKHKLMTFFIAAVLLAAVVLPASAAPFSAPCVAGVAYNPECDVDHNGVINVLDIQLAAGHWNQSGSFPLDAYWSITGNAATTPGTNFVGTSDNQALQLRVNNSRALLIQPNSNGSHNWIGGYNGNAVTDGVYGATIAGGGQVNAINSVTDNFGTVGGGRFNQAGNGDTSLDSQSYATVGGGASNVASASAATVAGGLVNHATGLSSTVGGGSQNDATGFAATIPGGIANLASGAGSLAAGQHAKAIHDGAFVWADSQNGDFSSTYDDSFNVRAAGGSRFQANSSSYGMRMENSGSGDGLRAYAATSNGTNWAAIWSSNSGTSPAIYGNTTGTYAGYFADQIFVAGGCTGCTLMYAAVNAGDKALEPGDVVAAGGVDPALDGVTDPVLRVHLSGADGVIGVVYSRVSVTPSERDGETVASIQATDGAVQPGDYMLVVVQGLVQVRIAAGEAVTPGQRVTVDEDGAVRALQSRVIDGMIVSEGAPTVGVAMEQAGDGLIWMLVNPQ